MSDLLDGLRDLTNKARDEEGFTNFALDTLVVGEDRKAAMDHLANITFVRSQLDTMLVNLMNREGTLNEAGERLAEMLGVPVVNVEWYDTGDEDVADWSAPVMATATFDGEDWARFAIADAVSDHWLDWLAENLRKDC